MSQEFLQGMQFHGTSDAIAKTVRREGFRPGIDGTLGGGVYTTPDPGFASDFAKAPKGSKRIGTVLGLAVTGEPVRTIDNPASTARGQERVYRPGQITQVVHQQSAYRTSATRAADRRSGLPPLPDTGPARPSPTPVSQLPKKEIKRRIAQKRAPKLPEM